MNLEKQLFAIAESCPFVKIDRGEPLWVCPINKKWALFDPLNDLNAAMRLLDHEDDWIISTSSKGKFPTIYVKIYRPAFTGMDGRQIKGIAFHAHSKTLPLAICEAYLKSVDLWEEE